MSHKLSYPEVSLLLNNLVSRITVSDEEGGGLYEFMKTCPRLTTLRPIFTANQFASLSLLSLGCPVYPSHGNYFLGTGEVWVDHRGWS